MTWAQVSATIGALDKRCRFRDCTHRQSPAAPCARVSMRIGLPTFNKLQREIRRDHMDPLARQQWQQQMKVRAARAARPLARETLAPVRCARGAARPCAAAWTLACAPACARRNCSTPARVSSSACLSIHSTKCRTEGRAGRTRLDEQVIKPAPSRSTAWKRPRRVCRRQAICARAVSARAQRPGHRSAAWIR